MKGRLLLDISKEEKWTMEALSSTFVNLTQQTGQARNGLNSYIELLEEKYEAVFMPEEGIFVPKPAKGIKKGKVAKSDSSKE